VAHYALTANIPPFPQLVFEFIFSIPDKSEEHPGNAIGYQENLYL